MAERYLTKPLVDLPKRQLSSIEQKLAGSYAKPENQWDLGTILRELDPTYTIPRGMDTLSNVDYGALKDMLLGKYQISKNPRQDLERAGQAALGTVEGIADVSPLALGIKPAIKAVKSLAPEMATMAERYSLDPNMYVVPPEGNLNFTSPITKDKLKGPDKQMVSSFVSQARNMPGVTKEGVKRMLTESEKLKDPTTVLTKEEFENALPASKYSTVDLAGASESDIDHYIDEAAQRLDESAVLENLGVPDEYHEVVTAIAMGDLRMGDLSPKTQADLMKIFKIPEWKSSSADASRAIHYAYHGERDELLYDIAHELLDMEGYGYSGTGEYAYRNVQRLIANDEPGYFEIGVVNPDYKNVKHYSHYYNAPEGTIGHIRGTLLREPANLTGDIKAPKNAYIVEEIQSDAQKGVEQEGPLYQAHGVLAKAAIQDAVEKGAEYIYFPSSYPISIVRSKPFTAYESIYDQAIPKEALNPIAKKHGIKIEPIMAEYEGKEVPYFYRLEITPEMREGILSGEGQATPGLGMAAGGIVGFDKGGKADESDNKMELQEYIKQEDLKTLIEELARRVNLSGEALQTKEGSQAFGRLDFRQPLSEDMDLGLGASGHYVKGKHFKDSGLDRADIALSKRLKNDSELRARLGANLNENMGKRGIDELMLEYTIPFKEGGKADKEEYSMPEKINRYVRQSQFKAADLVGLGPEVDFATTIPERYYPADEQHMGRGDAMRHLLLQAQLYKKYGELPAKTIGFLHEMLGGGQTDAEEAMDKYNDILGREIGKASKDRYDMVKRAMEAIENKKARVMTEAEKRESGYAEGGLVYNDDLINQLAEDLFGVK